jgi:DNA-binding NarL/FixJ family response regulator
VIRVGILWDGTMIQTGLCALVNADPEMEIAEAPEDWDILLLSGAPGAGGNTRHELPLPEPLPAVLLITNDVEPYRLVLEKAERGFGLLQADASEQEVKAAIRALAAGLLAGSPRLMRSAFSGGRSAGEQLPIREKLSPREGQVLQLLSLGLLNKEIAARLEISEHTVKYHISSIFGKLGATNRVEAIRTGIRLGLLEL